MIDNQLKYFLGDLIYLYQQKYSEALAKSKAELSESEKAHHQSTALAYWCVLDTLNSLLISFDLDEEFGVIVSRPSEPVSLLDTQQK